jgi:hypothetical protein
VKEDSLQLPLAIGGFSPAGLDISYGCCRDDVAVNGVGILRKL